MEQPHEEYVREFWACAAEMNPRKANAVIRQSPMACKAWFIDKNRQFSLQLDDGAVLESADGTHGTSIILLEDINLDWIAFLGSTLSIDVTFFCAYLAGLQGSSPWKAVFGNAVMDHKRPTRLHHGRPSMMSHHIDGVFQLGQPDQMRSTPRIRGNTNVFNRRVENHAPFGWEAATRISFCKVNESLCKDTMNKPEPMMIKSNMT